MLYRKIEKTISDHLKSKSDKILIVKGARQIGKSYIIRHAAQALFANYIEINLVEDKQNNGYFADVRTTDQFYMQISMLAGGKLGNRDNTIIFLDEIQEYPQLITLLKFLRQDNRFTYIASGSLLGVTLSDEVVSLPIGSVELLDMYPLDFEEFLMANGFGSLALSTMMECFKKEQSLAENIHNRVMELFKLYLIVGGMPDAVTEYIESKNVVKIRRIHSSIHELYGHDAAKYDNEHRLKIRRIYDMIPSNMENKKKRVVVKNIENKRGARFEQYSDEFDYLVSSGIALEVEAISNPKYPLSLSMTKNLLKLYINDVGLFTNILYGNNIRSILDDENSINLGSVYEDVVASELKAHGFRLFYYDNKKNGEVDFLVEDKDTTSILPLEIKSGKDYSVHSALSRFISTPDYAIKKAYVLSNEREVKTVNGITYLPIYYIMFFAPNKSQADVFLP